MRGPGTLMAAWALILAGGLVPARAAVTDYLGKSIVSVRVVVEGRDTNDTSVSRVIETRVGQPLSMSGVRESITHLFSLGRFEDVRVDASPASGGVVLRYDLSPIHPVSKIVFAGKLDAPGIDEGVLRRAIVERAGATPPVGRAADLAQTVRAVLMLRGYARANVTPRADVSHVTERTTLVFTIDPGPRTLVGAIDVVGTPSVPRAQFLDALGLMPGVPYQPAEIDAHIDRYIANRRSRGYYEAKVTRSVQLADDDRVANITLTVDHGPHVRVVFAGDPLPADRRADLVPVEREGSVDEDLLEDATSRIEEFLKAQGYRDAAAPHSREPSGDELLIRFQVKKGPQYRVSRVEISGNASVPLAEFEGRLRMRDGQPFSTAALDADVAAIEGVYHAAGFAGAKADSALEPEPPTTGAAQVPVLVRIVVREGVRAVVGSVRFSGNQAVSETTLRGGLDLQPNQPFVVARLAADRDQVQLYYANLGYATASVEVKPDFNRDGTRADIVYTIREGPKILIDHVIIVGNARISRTTIERELQFHPGDPLGRDAIYESQLRLYALGLFRRVTIQELRHGEETRRDLLVTVEEGPTTTVAGGGGIEARSRVFSNPESGGVAEEQIEFAPRASFEISRRNLFGKNRSVTAYASVAVHPKKSSVVDTTLSAPRDVRTEYRFLATFREPRIFDTAADLSLTATTQQQIRSSFGFTQRSAGIDVGRQLTRAVKVNGSYQVQGTEVFNFTVDQRLIDRVFPNVRLSSFSAFVIRDTRNDQLDPGSGELLSANGQLAARRIGSQVGFVKSFFTAQMFRTLPRTNGIVFAGRALLGLATGFPGEGLGDDGRDLPEAERFYAGGDTTVRGFALDSLGILHSPPQTDVDTLDSKRFPRGGNAEVIFNAELRVPVRGGLGVVPFVDVGNVFRRVTQFDLSELRSAVGFGLRYKSPVGPIRIDLGFKVNRQPDEHLTAWFVTFGQAF